MNCYQIKRITAPVNLLCRVDTIAAYDSNGWPIAIEGSAFFSIQLISANHVMNFGHV